MTTLAGMGRQYRSASTPTGSGVSTTVSAAIVGQNEAMASTGLFKARQAAFIDSLWLTVLSGLGLALFCVMVPAIGVVVVTVGIPLLALCLPLLRRLADVHRRWAERLLGTEIPSPYRPMEPANMPIRLARQARDPASWRDLAWLLYNSTVGLGLYIVSIVYDLLALLLWWLPPFLLLRVNARVAAKLLSPGRSWYLSERVAVLAESRAEVVDVSAAEIRRIERDLHDGAQAKLVALGINLGLAEQLVTRDPEQARQLLAEARQTSGAALAELRNLVRGIHPPVLADRGLVGAIQALALAAPMPVAVEARLERRLPAPAESAGYFAVAEVLTNVVKHAQATQAVILLVLQDDVLHLRVTDDGVGGARAGAGGGLRGIERRLAAFDGALVVDSPPGGPTTVTMTLPGASAGATPSPIPEELGGVS